MVVLTGTTHADNERHVVARAAFMTALCELPRVKETLTWSLQGLVGTEVEATARAGDALARARGLSSRDLYHARSRPLGLRLSVAHPTLPAGHPPEPIAVRAPAAPPACPPDPAQPERQEGAREDGQGEIHRGTCVFPPATC